MPIMSMKYFHKCMYKPTQNNSKYALMAKYERKHLTKFTKFFIIYLYYYTIVEFTCIRIKNYKK